MFTGLVERTGRIRRVSRGRGLVLEIAADKPWPTPLEEGESVAVNGVCLTVVRCAGASFTADVLEETESRTGFGGALPGTRVNLERALKAGSAMGGHLVQGHVDGRGSVVEIVPRGRDRRVKIRCGRVLAAQSVLKGSVAVDGVSLTISSIGDDFIAVDLIPTTASETTLGDLRVGSEVNLEGDVVGKYVARRLETADDGPERDGGLTEEALERAGFFA